MIYLDKYSLWLIKIKEMLIVYKLINNNHHLGNKISLDS